MQDRWKSFVVDKYQTAVCCLKKKKKKKISALKDNENVSLLLCPDLKEKYSQSLFSCTSVDHRSVVRPCDPRNELHSCDRRNKLHSCDPQKYSQTSFGCTSPLSQDKGGGIHFCCP
ncbi:hypothetical protein AB205_0071920 [Aquarana catesbeiana]|uniref:Uncharacterized protein n=1 Tax=Aquarana catesbeiana TaxID=8400 RepID=A0A2G9QM30_AQUCT|nr:hypothetical protein AB205_0071920 [Aquarana catesbeiana]